MQARLRSMLRSKESHKAEAAVRSPASSKHHPFSFVLPLTEKAKAAINNSAKWLYQRTIVELILRQRHIEASTDGRHIPLRIHNVKPLIDTRRGHAYISNNIRTSRYTVWDFIPKQLFFQLTRVANFYFLCVGIPQTIPGLSTTGNMTTILPLMFFVLLTIAKEGFDDYRRHRMDEIENAFFATVLGTVDQYSGFAEKLGILNRFNPFRIKSTARPWPRPKEEYDGVRWVPVKWSQVRVGDIVRICRDEPVPADIVLIHSEDENGVAYIDTMALDGETNLKSKQVTHAFAGCGTIEGIAKCKAEFIVEDPNPELFKFDGRVSVDGKPMPLTLNEVVYRGSVLRNTRSAIGVVINTGEECKLRMNSNQHPKAKKPALEKVCNVIVITLATYVVILSVGVSMGYVNWRDNFEAKAWYLDQATVPFYQIIIAFIIMFNNVVPLALYISLEIVKVGQLLMLNSDINMYDEESDTPAKCNTNTILENLGQVGYVFSDKTGTLTDNVMKFRKLSVAGTVWLHTMDLDQVDDDIMPPVKEVDTDSTDDAALKPEPVTVVMPTDKRPAVEIPLSPMSPRHSTAMSPRPSMGGRRSSSHWRSTGRPDHIQPEVNTSDLLDFMKLRPHSYFSQRAKGYLLAMALCHTCLPETKDDGEIDYQASSPDELALVRAAKELGYIVVQRNSQFVTLQLHQDDGMGERQTFEILDVIEFSSARKRMSIVVKYPDGRISVICKGADSAILPRLKMSSLALQKAEEVRKSADLEREMFRRSEQQELRNSFGGRPSLTLHRDPQPLPRNSSVSLRPGPSRSKSFEASRLMRSSVDRPRISISNRGVSFEATKSPYLSAHVRHSILPAPERFNFLDEPSINDESEVFSKCFRHLDEFATEGLRTLVYAQKFVSENEYRVWKANYETATTSLVDRQTRIEEAAESLEQCFDLVGATAIEDKLQKGVPETIDKLRRANINVWMLTGDKRETAINIAHSARLCKPGSDLFIIDSEKGPLGPQLTALQEDIETAATAHSVVVIDGHTLNVVAQDEALASQFYTVMIMVDSVICCRASPAQKALLVRAVREKLRKFKGSKRRGITLAIGDGANDLAMITASHVGVGISGKEGLQAARVADFSIAQFRYLQRLLLVHGRWGYIRTAKFILCTFWKEMFFYLPTAQYQRYNGYTGTSLYEATSLMVFNTLFTSLCTICMGVWEQDLMAETLLAVPELYVYGQRNMGLNVGKYTRWMLMAAIEGVVCWYGVWAGYGWINTSVLDPGLHAIGTLSFTAGVLYINWKLMILETHYKSIIVIGSFLITTWGWFAWTSFLDAVFEKKPSGTYSIRDSWTQLFGRDGAWWATLFIVLALLGLLDISVRLVKRHLIISGFWTWPPWQRRQFDSSPEEWPLELWQELEQDPAVFEQLKAMARDEDLEYVEADELTDEELLKQSEGKIAWLRTKLRVRKPNT